MSKGAECGDYYECMQCGLKKGAPATILQPHRRIIVEPTKYY
jgi:hypothetical protein